MLELDILFRPFVEACFVRLPPDRQKKLDELLNLDDIELLELTQNPDSSPNYTTLIRTVIQFQQTGTFEESDPKS